MTRIFYLTVFVITGLIGFTMTLSEIQAQTIFKDNGRDKTIAIEILKPDFTDRYNTTFLTSAIYLSTHLPIGKDLFFAGEFPFAHAEFESDFGFGDAGSNTNLEILILDWNSGLTVPST